jgi:hypothetical protein
MFLTPRSDLNFQHIEEFCRTWPEGVRVEYKQEPVQIPKIASSFANTFGGVWVLGVETDKATNMPRLPVKGMPAQPGNEMFILAGRCGCPRCLESVQVAQSQLLWLQLCLEMATVDADLVKLGREGSDA